jgi:hypothetical protein
VPALGNFDEETGTVAVHRVKEGLLTGAAVEVVGDLKVGAG